MKRKWPLIICSALSILMSLDVLKANAKDLGVHGTLFPIAEESLLKIIEKRLLHLQESGKLEVLKKQVQERIIRGVREPSAVSDLIDTHEPRSFTYDPSLILKDDIKGHQGQIIAKAGTKVNPLDYVNWGEPLLFIMGDQASHRSLIKNYPKAKVILVRGKPLELERHLQRPIFFDQAGLIVQKFGIKQVPCLITQFDKKLLVTEFKAVDDLQ